MLGGSGCRGSTNHQRAGESLECKCDASSTGDFWGWSWLENSPPIFFGLDLKETFFGVGVKCKLRRLVVPLKWIFI